MVSTSAMVLLMVKLAAPIGNRSTYALQIAYAPKISSRTYHRGAETVSTYALV
jgi:hypothetical protein